MQIRHIKKRSGGIRTIYALSPEESEGYSELLNTINQSEQMLPAAHGFFPNRSIVTNAEKHIGKAMTVNMDLKDFFDSVRPSQVRGKIPNECLERCFLDADGNPDPENGAPRQGLPTSPAIANIAAASMDKAIITKLSRLKIPGIVYTRYADDLSVSCDSTEQSIADKIKEELTAIIQRCGFKPNLKKTRVLRNKNRREICGVMTDDDGMHISRRHRRKLRAANHNLKMAIENKEDGVTIEDLTSKARGLEEFSKLKKPTGKSRYEKSLYIQYKEAAHFKKVLKLPILLERVEKYIKPRDLGDDCRITNDPVMIYGMSDFTTNWTSCMALTRGRYSYGLGVEFWQRHPGVSIAYQDSGEKKTIYGITRPRMRARCLIYIFEDGGLYYDHIYDNNGHRAYNELDVRYHKLADVLQKNGISPITETKGYIKGQIDITDKKCNWPYTDSVYIYDIYKDNKYILKARYRI